MCIIHMVYDIEHINELDINNNLENISKDYGKIFERTKQFNNTLSAKETLLLIHIGALYRKFPSVNNKLTKQLKENCPNHELEIIGEKVTEEKVITWRDSIPSYQYYLVRNNNNGNSLWICAPSYYVENHLISVVDTLVHSDTELLEKDANTRR